jgi:starch synthase
VTVAAPRYPGFEAGGLLAARRLTPLALEGGAEVHVYDSQLASGAKLVLFDAPALFDRPGIYESPEGEEYEDNAKRFGFLARAALALIVTRSEQGSKFDIVHAHDWAGALLPILLDSSPIPPLPCVLTLHDVNRQGNFSAKQAAELGLTEELLEPMKFDSRYNVLKGAVGFVEALTLPSERYAEQLVGGGAGGPLAEALEASKTPVHGILTGLDYAYFNPATDSWIETRYDAEDPSNKARNRTALIRELGLELAPGRPLLIALGPFDKDSGGDVLAQALPKLLRSELCVVVAGSGSSAVLKKLASLAERYPENCAYLEAPKEAVQHKLFAAADLMLSAARHVPSAHSILCAQRYGVLPIAHAVDSVLDAVVDCDAELETGTGILYDALDAEALVAAVQRGVTAVTGARSTALVSRIMRRDLGWDRPARRYLHVYRQALGAKS